MANAFGEHFMFSIPIDAYTQLHYEANEDDCNICNQSLQTSCDDVDADNSILKDNSRKVYLDNEICKFQKKALMSITINIFYQCYRPERDQLDPSCLSILVLQSIFNNS